MRPPLLAILLACLATLARADVTVAFASTPETIRSVDRVRIEATATAEPSVWIGPIQLAADENEWTVLDVTTGPLQRTADGSPRRTATFLLEPRRPGEYKLPAVRVPWHSTGDESPEAAARSGIAGASPGTITVTSVLPADDTLELEPPRPIAPPPPDPEPGTPWLLFAVPVLALGALAAILLPRLAHRAARPAEPPAARFRRLHDAADLPGALHAARELARTHPALGLSPLIDRCDLARFAPDHQAELDDAVQRLRAAIDAHAAAGEAAP